MPFHLVDHGLGHRRIVDHVHQEVFHAAQPPRPLVNAPGIAQHRMAAGMMALDGRRVDVALDHGRRQGFHVGDDGWRRQGREGPVEGSLRLAPHVANRPLVEGHARQHGGVEPGRIIATKPGRQRERAQVGLKKVGRILAGRVLAELPPDRLAEAGECAYVQRKRNPLPRFARQQETQIVQRGNFQECSPCRNPSSYRIIDGSAIHGEPRLET